MPKSKGGSKNPAYPNADPTAPGGMSQRALVAELVSEHGWSQPDAKALKWAEQIEAVAQGRLAREREATAEIVLPVADGVEMVGVRHSRRGNEDAKAKRAILNYPQQMVREEAALLEDDFDALMAELDDGLLDEDDSGDEEPTPAPEPKHVPSWRKADPGCPKCGHATHGDTGCPDMTTDCLCTFVRPSLLVKDPAGIGTLDYSFNGHMGAGPSASERWITCTASLGASRKFLETLTPNQQAEFAVANIAARQGTTAHAAAEVELLTLLGRVDEIERDNTLMELSIHPDTAGESYDEEMADYITEYTDLIQQYVLDRGEDHVMVEHVVEAVVPLSGLHEGEAYAIRGSADAIVLPISTDPNLVVGDLKYGKGIDVGVEENSQARIYALGVLDSLTDDEGFLTVDVETVTLYIIQPRLGGLKSYTMTLDELLDWRDDVLSPALTKALYGISEGATFEPNEGACQFCPARGTCSALAEARIEQAQDLFDAAAGPDADEFEAAALTDARLGELLAQAKAVEDIYSDLKGEAQRRLYRGDEVPGFHLVNYSPPRYWSEEAVHRLDPTLMRDEGAVLSFVHRALLWTEPKLLSPTQALAVLKRHQVENADDSLSGLIIVPEKKPVIAPVNDRRKAWEGRPPEAMFDIEEEEEA